MKMKKTLFGILLMTLVFVGMISSSLVYEKDVNTGTKSWHVMTFSALNATVANGDTGIVNVLTYPHQSSPYALYDDDLNEANAYEHFDGTPSCGEELEGTTPYDTLFDFVVIIQWDYDQAYNETSAALEKDMVKVFINITSTDDEINGVSSEIMLEGDFYNTDGTDDTMMNCYVVGTGGFDIDMDETFTISDIKLYWYG